MIADKISGLIILAVIAIIFFALAKLFMSKSKEYVNWEQEKLTKYQRSDMKDKYETFDMIGCICYTCSIITAIISVVILADIIPWIVSPYGAFINLLMPH